MASLNISSPIGSRNIARCAALLAGSVLGLGVLTTSEAGAALTSSANYAIQSQVFASGGGRTASGSYNLLGTVGQSSPLGRSTSANFTLLPGFLSTVDSDGDGFADYLDAFPLDDSEQLDTDGDGIGNNADPDDDNDGMSDAYEVAFGLDPLDDADALLDGDGDGLTNLEEFLGGETDPTDGGSFPVHVADFDGDFRSDILWRNSATGTALIWLMDGFTKLTSGSLGAVPLEWHVVDLGDFTGEGKADILWRHAETGKVLAWQMDGLSKVDAAIVGAAVLDWQIVGLGDFDGDGMADILWRNGTTGSSIVWLMNGLARDVAGSGPIPWVPVDWKVAGVGDFDHDGKADILWRNTNTGATVAWKMNGLSKELSVALGVVPLEWTVVGLGDLDGGGRSDIVWRNGVTGMVLGWLMDGFAKEASGTIGSAGLDWQIPRLGDFGAGGRYDLQWRNTALGGNILWMMSGLAKEDSGPIPGVPVVWEVQ